MIMADMAFDLPLVCAGALLGVAACLPLCWAVMRAWKPRPTANIGVGIACVMLSFLVLVDTLCRTAAVKIVEGSQERITIGEKDLRALLEMSPIRHDRMLEQKKPGIVTGLAWTQAGGEILFIETALTKGEGKVIITGQLGDVMKESVQIALSLIKGMFPKEAEIFEKNDLHVHVPAGAVPKDGPSAGITITTALASLVTGRAVDPELAMTGEVSLRGVLMPIGGLPEKLMAAQRAGIRRVIIPEENMDDLPEVAEEVKKDLHILPLHRVEEVLEKTGINEK